MKITFMGLFFIIVFSAVQVFAEDAFDLGNQRESGAIGGNAATEQVPSAGLCRRRHNVRDVTVSVPGTGVETTIQVEAAREGAGMDGSRYSIPATDTEKGQ